MPANDTKLIWGPTHVNSNMIVAIDIRVGGDRAEASDLLEIAVLPVSHSFKLHPTFKMFQVKIRPSWPVDKKIARLNNDNIGEYTASSFDAVGAYSLFERWVKAMEMNSGKKLIPLVWDWGRIQPRLINWMGEDTFKHHFFNAPRDCLAMSNWLNDRTHYWGEDQDFKQPTFAQFLTHTGTDLIDKNSVTSNAMALIDAYRSTLKMYIPGYKGPTT